MVLPDHAEAFLGTKWDEIGASRCLNEETLIPRMREQPYIKD